jgi:PKHD-type hydroxylase
MFIIPRILTSDELNQVQAELATAEFVEGKHTAGRLVQAAKSNLQLKRAGTQPTKLDLLVLQALSRNEMFRSVTAIRRMLPPIFGKYLAGMQYGAHVDNAIMGAGEPIRADISVTLFLNDPASYDGGELIAQTSMGERPVKLAAGDCVVYPATSLHRVAPITRGERLVAATWVQSFVKDQAMREVLHDLNVAAHRLAEKSPDSDELKLITRSYANLLRHFADA